MLTGNGGDVGHDTVIAGGSIVVNQSHRVSSGSAVFKSGVTDDCSINGGSAWARAVLGIGVCLKVFGMLNEAASPDELEHQIVVGFVEMDDPDFVCLWYAWFFL